MPPLLCSSFQQNSPGSCLYRLQFLSHYLLMQFHQALTLPLPCHRSCPGHSPGLMGTPPPLLSLDLSPADSSPLWNPFLTWPRVHHSPMRLLQPRVSLCRILLISPTPQPLEYSGTQSSDFFSPPLCIHFLRGICGHVALEASKQLPKSCFSWGLSSELQVHTVFLYPLLLSYGL